jgi:hypothetical protein
MFSKITEVLLDKHTHRFLIRHKLEYEILPGFSFKFSTLALGACVERIFIHSISR